MALASCLAVAMGAGVASASGQDPTPVTVGSSGAGTGGTVACSSTGASGNCQITVTNSGTAGSSNDGAGHTSPSSAGQSGAGAAPSASPSPTRTIVNGACTYAPDTTYVPQPGSSDAVHSGQKGAWYDMTCPDAINSNGIATTQTTQVWLTNPPVPSAAAPLPATLAARARSSLALPKPAIAASPAVGRPQLVGVPTWTWLSSSAWKSVSATASVPGESVTATATPVSVTWDFGDGASSVCTGPGSAFAAGTNPMQPSPTCGHTYRTASGSAPGGKFQLTATITWRIDWTGAGQAGTLNDLTTTSAIAVTVEQDQALVTATG